MPIILLSLSCPLLLELDLIGCQLVTSQSLCQLFRTSGHLRELSLAGCSEIDYTGFPVGNQHHNESDSDYNPTFQHGAAPISTAVTLPPRAVLTKSNGEILPSPPPLFLPPALSLFDHLRYLDLTSLSLLTDSALDGIVKYMPRIRNLILAKCLGVTDEGVESICKLGKALHYLHLGHVSS